uniref:RING-CH-type domain-containing protein n=1 Tax=Populus davidiana TaxID=266767 RepID=A0A6M2F9C5_9ROSI
MSVHEMSHLDLEPGTHHRSVAGSDISTFSDAENGSCYSQFYSTTAGSYDDYSFACVSEPEGIDGVVLDSRRVSSVSDCSVEVGIVNGVPEIKVHLSKVERDCRICHLDLESNSHESGVPIELGCSCKDDLAAAHKQCAETWFKIKGNKTCEICHSIARNVVLARDIESIEHSNETSNVMVTSAAAASTSNPTTETRSFWQGHRFLNFLLACVVFAFVLSWLFHFNVPSS